MAKQPTPKRISHQAWQGPILLTQKYVWPRNPGVYRLRAQRNGNWLVLPRLCGADSEGILYIGSGTGADGLRSRLNVLRRAWANADSREKHVAAKRYWKSRALQQFFADAEFYVEFREFPRSKADGPEYSADGLLSAADVSDVAITEERNELRRYEQRFGDMPPLNNVEGIRIR